MNELQTKKPRFIKNHFNKIINKNPENSFKEIIEFFTSNSNRDLHLTQENFHSISRIVDITCEIQRSILNYGEPNSSRLLLNSLAKKIISNSDISGFIKFLFYNYDLDTGKDFLNEKNYHQILYSAINELYVFTKDENAMEGIASQYSGDWHFLFELLQNARDADSKRVLLEKVKLKNRNVLLFANDGNKFSSMDVWGISSIGQGSKNRKNIGYFGIGFKSAREIFNSSLIISKPFQFRLNLILEDKEAIEWNLKHIPKNSEISDFNNKFYLEGITDENLRAFENHIENIDQKFMLFLDPLKDINIVFDENAYPLKVESLETNGIPISKIEDGLYVIHTISEDLNLKDEKGKEIGEREVKVVFKIQKEGDSEYIIKKHDSEYALYAYFPVINRKPQFNFILHGHFSLINSREDLEIKEDSEKWKKDINETLLRKKAPKCFLELYEQLSKSNKLLFKNLEKLVPFKTNENKVYSLFRDGLILELKEYQYSKKEILFWWENNRYIPFSNIVFVEKEDKDILTFLHNHASNKFREFMAQKLNLKGLKGSIYICDELDKRIFCQEIFNDSEIANRDLNTSQVMKLMRIVLESYIFPKSEGQNYISSKECMGYFGSLENLRFFQEELAKWHYFKENRFVQEEIFNYYLLILQDYFGNEYLSCINNPNFFYITEEFINEFPEYMEVIHLIHNYSVKKNLELPIFLYIKKLKDQNGYLNTFHKILIDYFQEIQRNNTYSSLYQLINLIFNGTNGILSKILLENEEILSNLHQMIKRSFTKLKKELGNSTKIPKYYTLLTQNTLIKESREDYFISDLISNLLKIPIFSTTRSSKDLFKFTDLFWGNQEYLELLIQTSYGKTLNIIHKDFYEVCGLVNFFLEKFKDEKYFAMIYPEFSSKHVSSLKIRQNDTIYKIINKSPQNIAKYLTSCEPVQRVQNIILAFFTDKKIFEDFSRIYYQNLTEFEEYIHLSKLYKYEKYTLISNRNSTFEIQDDYIDNDIINLLIKFAYDSLDLTSNWIHKNDIKYNLSSKTLYIHDIILLFLNEYLAKINDWDKWNNFYLIVQKFMENKNNQIDQFKQILQKSKISLKFENCRRELKDLNQLYIQPDFVNLDKNQKKIIKLFIDNNKFEIYIPANSSLKLIRSLLKFDLIKLSQFMNTKKFLVKVLSKFFKSDDLDFFKGDDLQFYKDFLGLLKANGFKLKDLKNFQIVPNLNYNFMKVELIPNKYNIYLSEFIEELPIYDVWEDFPEEGKKIFEDWLDPEYFRVFNSIFNEDILEIKQTDGVDYKGRDIYECFLKPQILDDDCRDDLPPFIILHILEIYFKIECFNIQNEKHLKYIQDSLQFFKNLSFKTDKTKHFFINQISNYTIFPTTQGSDQNYLLVNLNNNNLISREFEVPEFLSEFHEKKLYLHKDIENLLVDFKWDFKFLKRSERIPLKYILDNCSHLFSDNNPNFLIESHIQLVNLIFQNNNFLHYYSNEKMELKQFLENITLKSKEDEQYCKPNKLRHPKLYDAITRWWKTLITVEFPSNTLINTIDLEFYNLKQSDFIKHEYNVNNNIIFTSNIDIIRTLERLYRILNKSKNHISGYLSIYQNFGVNFAKFYNNDYFTKKVKPSKKDLREKLIVIFKLLMGGIKQESDIFNKYFLTIEQLNQKKYRFIIPKEKIITLDDEFFNPLHRISKYSDDEEGKIENSILPFFKSINNIELEIIKEVIEKKENIYDTILALNNLFSEHSLKSQKQSEAYHSLKFETKWFENKFTLNSLFLKNPELDISNIGKYIKKSAFIDDLLQEIDQFEPFLKFFGIKKLLLKDIINHLKELSSNAKLYSKNILDILTLFNDLNKITENIKSLKVLEIVPVIKLETKEKEYHSLDHLLSSLTLYSTKMLIIENILDHWFNAKELKKHNSYLLFDKIYRKSTGDWEKIIESMLNSVKDYKSINIRRIDTFPDILQFNQQNGFEIEANEVLFENEIRFYKIMLEYILRNGSKKAFNYLKMKNVNLTCLDSNYSFIRISKAYGDIQTYTFNGKEITLSNVFLRKLFKEYEKEKKIYYSNDLEPSDLEENFTSYLLDLVFPNHSGNINALNEFRTIFYWRVDFTDDKLDDFEHNQNLLREYLEKKEIGLVSKTITDIKDSIMEFIDAILTLKESYKKYKDIFKFLSYLKKNLLVEEKRNNTRFTVHIPKIRIDPEEYEEWTESHIKDLLMEYLKVFKNSKTVQKKQLYVSSIDPLRFKKILALKAPEVGKIKPIFPTESDMSKSPLHPASPQSTPPQSTPPQSTSSQSTPPQSTSSQSTPPQSTTPHSTPPLSTSSQSIPPQSTSSQSTPSTGKVKRAAGVRMNSPISRFPKKSKHPRKVRISKNKIKYKENQVLTIELTGENKKYHDDAEYLLRDIYSGKNHEVGVPCQICRSYCRDCEMSGNVREEHACTATCSLIHFNSKKLVSSRKFELWSTKELEQLETKVKVDLEDFFRGSMLILCHNHGLAFSGFKENIRSQIYDKFINKNYKTIPGGDIIIAIKNILYINSNEEVPVEFMFSEEHLKCFKYTYEIFKES